MRIIAFDIGTVRTGVAISDSLGMIASPLEVCARGKSAVEDAKELAGLARMQGAERILVGMPVALSGEEEIAAGKVREFVEILKEHAPCEVVTYDERMTTKIAERAMIEGDVSRMGRRRKVDAVAATVLLQSYLDSSGRPTGD